jgi:hypothetical protein
MRSSDEKKRQALRLCGGTASVQILVVGRSVHRSDSKTAGTLLLRKRCAHTHGPAR